MYMEFPDGEGVSVDWDDWPDECFLYCDATFPYAEGDPDCPAAVYSPTGEDVGILGDLDSEISRVVANRLSGVTPQASNDTLPTGIKCLFASISEAANFSDGEIERDADADLASYKEYLGDVVSGSATYITETQGEDEGGMPGTSSGYRLYWDRSPSDAIKSFHKRVADDIDELKKI
jgi:hypothetical protein